MGETNKRTYHGESKSRLYRVWNTMKFRCLNPSCKEYPDYGGRAIKVCPEWQNNYLAFRDWALSNGYDPLSKRGECTIDRINNDGPYSPQNCRIATQKSQCRNRRSTKFVTIGEKTACLKDWAKLIGVSHTAISQAKRRGIPYEEYIRKRLPKQKEAD